MSNWRPGLVLFALLGCGLFASTEREIAIEELERLQERHFSAPDLTGLRDECIANIKAIKTAPVPLSEYRSPLSQPPVARKKSRTLQGALGVRCWKLLGMIFCSGFIFNKQYKFIIYYT
jgi:hypothetical protein